ncbi:MAG TPA: alpha/beta hydrolase, partial [Pseudomonadales bacterium]|nr:alpha/beta hydrolase [Pseudomonadales bacterium]
LVVLIHGAGSSALIWDTVQTQMAAAGFRTLAISLPGAGGSDHPTDPAAYSPDSYAVDIKHSLDALNISQFSIVGHSLGVSNVLGLVDDYGSGFDVQAMVMVAGGGGGLRQAPSAKEIEEIRSSWPTPDPADADKRRATWEKLHMGLTYKIRNALWADIQANPFERAFGQRISARKDRTPFLNSTEIPTLVVSGDNDSVVPLALTLEMYPKLKSSVRHLHVMHGVDHYPNAETPNEISRVTINFLLGYAH